MSKYVLRTEDDFEENEIDKVDVDDSKKGCDVKLTPYEALIFCMREYGRPKMSYLMDVTGLDRKPFVEGLDLYQDPVRYDIHHDDI